MADNDFMRQLEGSLQYLMERVLRERANSSKYMDQVVAFGGGIAMQHYLIGAARERMTNRADMYTRFTMYCSVKDKKECEAVAWGLADSFNELGTYNGKKPHAAWINLCVALRRLGVIAVGKPLPDFDDPKLKLFRSMLVTLDGKKRWSVGLALRQFGQTSDLAMLTIEPAPSDLLKALKSDAVTTLSGTSWGAPVALVPLSLLLQQPGVSPAARVLLARAVMTAQVDLASPKAYDFALRAVASMLNVASGIPDSLKKLDVYDRVKKYTLAKDDPELPDDLHARAKAYVQKLSLDVASADLSGKKPGRYADMQLQLREFMRGDKPLPGSKTGLSVHHLLWLYTAQSSRLNIACLLGSTVRELHSKLVVQGRFSANVSAKLPPGFDPSQLAKTAFADYMDDMDAVFAAARPPRPVGGVPYKPLVLFRAVDLFEMPRQSVYARPLPFDIINHTLCSTSTQLRRSIPFLKLASSCCMLRITVPSAYTRMLAIKDVSAFPQEEEVLLPRGSVFTVQKRSFRRWNGVNVALLEATVRYDPDALNLSFDDGGDGHDGGGSGRGSRKATRAFVDLSSLADVDAKLRSMMLAVIARARG